VSWEELQRPGPDAVAVDGVELRRGSRVRLRPRAGADVFDLALAGRLAVVDAIEEDMEGTVHLVVTVDDDPGRDLGAASQLAHRFFFAPEEVEPLAARRILVAGIGNVFLGDDGFGVALAERLAARALPAGIDVVDYGIRGIDLAYALGDGYDAVVLLDAAPTGRPPGTLSVIEPEIDDIGPSIDAHGMDPVKVLGLARSLGAPLPRTLVVACAPQTVLTGEEEDVVAELSEPVRAALEPGVNLVESLLLELTSTEETEVRPS
jgi:hydrogenase maturation protease